MVDLPLHYVELAPAETRPAAPAASLTVEICSTLASLDALADDWARLENQSGPNSVFQSFRHIQIWSRHFLRTGEDRGTLHIVVVRDHGRAVLIMPLVIGRRGPARIARLAGDPIAQYNDILLDPRVDGPSAFSAALNAVKASGADVIVFRRVRADSHLLAIDPSKLQRGAGGTASPYTDLVRYKSYEAFQLTLSKNMRKGLRSRRKHMEEIGGVSFEIFAGGSQARDVLADAMALKGKWLIRHGAVSTAFVDPSTKESLLDLAGSNQNGSGAVVMRLLIGGEPAAIRFGFEFQGTYFAYLSAYDERFAHLSPGKMLMDQYLSRFRERELARLDMLCPVDTHKTDWCDSEIAAADFTLALTLAGRLYAEVYQEKVRPTLQKIWSILPNRLRSVAVLLTLSI